MNPITLEQMINHVEDMPALPQMITKIIELTEDPDSTVQDIEREILKDQGLTARVLRLANSAYYGYPRRISTISQATVLLGFQTIRSITLAATVSQILVQELPGYALQRQELWRQSQSCAMISRYIAKHLGIEEADQIYIAGLLRDIGKVILNYYMTDQYQQVIQKVEEEGATFLEAEEEIFGFNHAQVGARVAEKWNLPQELVDAIAYHHCPEDSIVNSIMTAIVHVADAMVMMMGIGLGVDGMTYMFSPYALEMLGLSEEETERLFSEAIDLLADEDSFQNDYK